MGATAGRRVREGERGREEGRLYTVTHKAAHVQSMTTFQQMTGLQGDPGHRTKEAVEKSLIVLEVSPSSH